MSKRKIAKLIEALEFGLRAGQIRRDVFGVRPPYSLALNDLRLWAAWEIMRDKHKRKVFA